MTPGTGGQAAAQAPADSEPVQAGEAAAADETTPLVGSRAQGVRNGDSENLGTATQAERLRQQRWISFAVSLVMVTVVTVLLVLFGRKWTCHRIDFERD